MRGIRVFLGGGGVYWLATRGFYVAHAAAHYIYTAEELQFNSMYMYNSLLCYHGCISERSDALCFYCPA